MPIDPLDVTLCLDNEDNPYGSTSPPVVHSSLFVFPTFAELVDALGAEHENAVYSRGQNPTVAHVERKLAALERAEACKCFSSGMAAISAVLLGLLEHGDHVVFVNQIYGPTLQLAGHLERFGVEHDVVLDLSLDAVERALRPTTKLLWLESPGTMTFRLIDLEAVSGLARAHGVLTCIDNTWSTPLLQKPLELGIDLSVHTASKYLGGHSDLIAGALATRRELLEPIFYRAFLLQGGALGPFEAWALNRGLMTLPSRLERQGRDALAVARFLEGHDRVARVHHPALGEDAALAERQLAGTSGVFSFELADDGFADVSAFIDRLERFRIGVSWGGVESLVIAPARRDNAEALRRQGIAPGLVRLSVGLDGAEVLVDDLERALAR